MFSTFIRSQLSSVLIAGALGGPLAAAGQEVGEPVAGVAARLARSIADDQLRSLVVETLERNPDVAALAAQARAVAAKAPRVKGLPDPVVGATAWIQGPETRTGPQILTLSFTQPLPWLGKLSVEEEAARSEADAWLARVEALRLELVTTVRRHYYELAFLARQRAISEDYFDHLRQHERISQSRYATGTGSSQDVVKIQAEITLAERLLIDIDRRRVEIESQLNALRDRGPATVLLPARLPKGTAVDLDYRQLVEDALELRPELRSADAAIAAAAAKERRVEKQRRPDFGVGLTYTFVDPRQDPAGQTLPPAGNGDDIVGILGAVSIPLWRQKLAAGTAEAHAVKAASEESRRAVEAGIEAAVGDLVQRIPLVWRQLRLLEDILILQAEESVRSAESGYVSGVLKALDLLDAEHVFFDAEIAVARARADYAIHLAELEGAAARPLVPHPSEEEKRP